METRMRSGWARSRSSWAAIGLTLVIGSFAGLSNAQDSQSGSPSDPDIWRMIIRDSIASYRRLCPCPYSPNRAGRSCGTRSAHSRVDGSVMCYVSDIPEVEVVRYRERLQGQSGGQGQQNQQ
jgi:hypothetical protein